MTHKDTAVTRLLNRPEVDGQSIQRRCFISSSNANRATVHAACEHLSRAGWFVYDFTRNDVLERLYHAGVRTFAEAKTNTDFQETAEADLLMLRSLGAADVLLLILPAGLSAGWEAGFAFGRGTQIIVCTEGTEVTDVPLYHADHIFSTMRKALDYLSS